MIGHKADIPRMQSDFFRDCYYKMLRWFFISTLIILLLIVAIVYKLLFTEPHQYYATTTAGQIIPMVPK